DDSVLDQDYVPDGCSTNSERSGQDIDQDGEATSTEDSQNKCGNHRQTAQTSRSASAKDEEDQALASCVKDKYGLIKCNGGLRKGNKKKDFCFFCNEYVLNFSRHIQRNHSSEIEVQRILSLAPNTAERKQQLMILRKKGNFLVSTEIPKAVRSPMVEKNLRPCDYCLGMYSSRQLWR
ncbi:unnamed protein product, partial [Tenebrio molitor]